MNTNKLMASSMVGCLLVFFVPQASANTINLNVGLSSQYVLGEAIFNGDNSLVPSGGQETRDLTMVNSLVHIYNGTLVQSAPYVLSANDFGAPPLPDANPTGDVVTPASGISYDPISGDVTITLGSAYQYLIAAYDGKNSGAVVWDIGGIAAGTTLEFPRYAQPNSGGTDLVTGQYGITTWSLFNPTTSVPDGGSTVLLLGAALSVMGLIRRRKLG